MKKSAYSAAQGKHNFVGDDAYIVPNQGNFVGNDAYIVPCHMDGIYMNGFCLAEVVRPAQYIGGEYNSIIKDWEQTQVKMAFCFPDTYEVGMSHLGLRLLYEAVNREQGMLLERCFAPMEDVRGLLLKTAEPLCALESGHALADFDVLGFTLQYELSYTNVLDMLHLANLPVLKAERESWPLIIAGGPCAFNPEPMADFIDLFCLGESEEQLPALLRLVAKAKEQGLSKSGLLRQAMALPGIYVPFFYQAHYDENGSFQSLQALEGAPAKIPKTLLRVIDDAPVPLAPILPHTQVVHDRIMLELMRGCGRGCRFCQAGIVYRPVREKQPGLLIEQAQVIADNSGYEDIGLISLSSADYSEITPLTEELITRHSGCGRGLSLPSLRVDAFSVTLANTVGKVRKSGLTLAPEAGSQRLRDIINKGVREEDIMSALKAAFAAGYSTIKLYFMIGLPYETMADIAAIAALCQDIAALYQGHKPPFVKKRLTLTLGVASFVPKTHTPFQWHGQDSAEILRQKQKYLLDLIRPLKQVKMRYHDVAGSLLEAALARGDRRLGTVILKAWQSGCHADGWTEHFKAPLWWDAFAASGISCETYACRTFGKDEPLPWQHIDSGVSHAWLWAEYEKAAQEITTQDCREGNCTGCGICQALECALQLASPCTMSAEPETLPAEPESLPAEPETLPAESETLPAEPNDPASKQRWRLRLSIDGSASWLSQLDLLAVMEKAIRRAALPIAFSQGFNPHMLISWGPAHAVGLSGDSEYTDLLFTMPLPANWHVKLNKQLPVGLKVISATLVPENTKALTAILNRADYSLELLGDIDSPHIDQAISNLIVSASYIIERQSPKGHKNVNIRPALLSLTREGHTLLYSCALNVGPIIKPQELIAAVAPGCHQGACRRKLLHSNN